MSVVDDIKTRLDVVEIVSGYVSLQKAGRNFKAPCPFHTEKTPSFIVNPERQSWRCFGACATGGDLFSFVMRQEGLDFAGAIRLLAHKAGVSLKPRDGNDRSEKLYSVNQSAAKYYQDFLRSSDGTTGARYLRERGVDDDAIEKFGLGLSPDGWDGLRIHLSELGFAQDLMVEAGLLQQNDKGRSWDFFKGRLMFPIHDARGRVAGFGARALDDSMPKYLNTSGTSVFDKRSILYGLHLASGPIRDQRIGVVVEGYMDVIAAHQHGYPNVVASMGTALTERQVRSLRGLGTNFVLALDPDAAGQEATLRSLESSWRVFDARVLDNRRRSVGALYSRDPVTLRVAALPSGRDPDRLIREDSAEWQRIVADAEPVSDFYIRTAVAHLDVSTPQGKEQAVRVLAPVVTSAEPVLQDHYFDLLSKTLGVSKDVLKASISRPAVRGRSSQGRATSGPSQAADITLSALAGGEGRLEDYTLSLVLAMPDLRERVQDFAPEHFHKSEDREVFTRWLASSTIADLRLALDESLHDHLDYLTGEGLLAPDRQNYEAALVQCLQRLEERRSKEEQEALVTTDDASVPPSRDVEDQVADVNARLKASFSQRAG